MTFPKSSSAKAMGKVMESKKRALTHSQVEALMTYLKRLSKMLFAFSKVEVLTQIY